ncbi:hypothetical protein WMW72_33930 [Paenibacillus filicis]|uniref:Uncharacterized protein n=1 Tax=Paenibacillus filicis TaxID=669464 RepID=A0ABU9DVK4_9BACL
MAIYRFEVSSNGFKLFVHTADKEETGINRCKRYMTEFQKTVANVPMKVVISKKEKQKEYWRYRDVPYVYLKTLIRKPLVKRSKSEEDKPEE